LLYFENKQDMNPQQGDVPSPKPLSAVEWFNQSLHSALIEWETSQEAAHRARGDFDSSTEVDEPHNTSHQLENLSLDDSGLPLKASSASSPPSLTASTDSALALADPTTESIPPSSVDPLEGIVIEMGNERLIMFTCPYEECQGTITVAPNQVNCGVFRHGVYKATGRPIGAHLSKSKCLELIHQQKVYGCAQPFRIRKILKEVSVVEPLAPSSSLTETRGEMAETKIEEAVPAEDEKKNKEPQEVQSKKFQKQSERREKEPGGKATKGKEFRYYIEKCGYI
jgi:hypothetical protein